MSDTDDGFDEEAVREELREKYADDDRGETERMSELLLQGATMTNQHCDRCGTPIFRYEGQSFCPNCQQPAGEQTAATQEQGQAQQPAEGESARRQADQQPQTADADAAETAPASQPTGNAAEREQAERRQIDRRQAEQRTERQQSAERRQPAQADHDERRERPPAQTEQPATGGEQTSAATGGEAADALESSIAALARRAAGADDPRRAREFLEAAREAAEAVDALHRNA